MFYAWRRTRSTGESMVDESNNLGPATSWHIRSVPEGIRQAVVDRAHTERISVGELLTRMVAGGVNAVDGDKVDPRATPSNMVATVDAGAMVDAKHRKGNAVDTLHPVHASHRFDAVANAVDKVDADRLLKLLQAADLVTKVQLPKSAQATVRAMIAVELRAMRRDQRKMGQQLALPAPE